MRLLLPLIVAVALSAAAAVSFVRGEQAVQIGAIAVANGWARATPPGAAVGAAYVAIHNGGTAADRLLRVDSSAAGTAIVHETVEAGGVAEMRPAEAGLAVAGGETVAMRPGGLHIMLMDLRAPLRAGETLPLTLVFEGAGAVSLAVPVEPIGSPGPTGAQPAADNQSGH